jgi:amino acid transporter
MRSQRVFFAFSMLGLGVAGVLMAVTSRSAFERDFAKFGNYHNVIAAAGKSGFALGAHNSIGGLIAFTALGFTVLALAQMPAYAAGELRRPRRNAVFSMIGALLFSGILLAALAGLAQKTFGLDFLGGMTALSNAGSHAYPSELPAPFFLLYTGMLTHSTLLTLMMTAAIVFALVGNVTLSLFAASRNLLAWSLDGVLPEWIRETDSRHHTPTHAILALHLASFAILIPFVFGPKNLFNFVFSAATMQAIVFFFTAAAATFFAVRLPAVFKSSPYNRRILNIPLMTIIGLCSMVIYGYFAVKLITDSRAGANAPSGLVAICVGFALGVVIYLGAWAIQKRRGVDVIANYKELPPE